MFETAIFSTNFTVAFCHRGTEPIEMPGHEGTLTGPRADASEDGHLPGTPGLAPGAWAAQPPICQRAILASEFA